MQADQRRVSDRLENRLHPPATLTARGQPGTLVPDQP
jgi:hypothetical protein